MSSLRYSEQDVKVLLDQIHAHRVEGASVAAACRAVGVSELTYYRWVRRFGTDLAPINKLEELIEENKRLRLIVANQAEHIRTLALARGGVN